MKTLFFAVNTKQRRFFGRIADYLGREKAHAIYSKACIIPSMRALGSLQRVDLSPAIDLKTDDFVAKRGCEKCRPLLKSFFTLLTLFNYLRYYRAISPPKKKHGEGQIVVWNGILYRQAIALEIAKLHGIKPVYVEAGLLPNRITVDRKGVNFNNSVPRERAFFEAYHNERGLPSTLIPRNPKNAKKFAMAPKTVLPDRYVFIPFQVDYDTQILVHSPWIKNMRMLFDLIERMAEKVPELSFVFKEHPSSIKAYPDLHRRAARHERLLFANGYPTQQLIEQSEAVITVNSTVGIESLLFHKRVMVLGNAFYAIDGIAKGIGNEADLAESLRMLSQWHVEKALIDNFLKYLYYDYLIEGDFETENPRQMEQIARILHAVDE